MSFISLWPSDAIWQQGCGSILAQVKACCLTAPNMNQCWLIIKGVLWHSPRAQGIILHNEFEICLKIIATSHRGHWVTQIEHNVLPDLSTCGDDVGVTQQPITVDLDGLQQAFLGDHLEQGRHVGLLLRPAGTKSSLTQLPPGQNGRHFTDVIFSDAFLWMKSLYFDWNFTEVCPIDNDPALVKIMAWRPIGDKPLSEPMLTQFTDSYMGH